MATPVDRVFCRRPLTTWLLMRPTLKDAANARTNQRTTNDKQRFPLIEHGLTPNASFNSDGVKTGT